MPSEMPLTSRVRKREPGLRHERRGGQRGGHVAEAVDEGHGLDQFAGSRSRAVGGPSSFAAHCTSASSAGRAPPALAWLTMRDHDVAPPRAGQHVPGHAGHVAQRAGLQVGAAERGARAPQRAVEAADRQRADQLRHHRARPGGLQQPREQLRADARVARQARAVVDHQRRAPALPKRVAEPSCCSSSRASLRRAAATLRQRERQEQLLRHHVVAELVDVAHHLGQRRRGRARSSVRVAGAVPSRTVPLQLAAHARATGPSSARSL